jgi:hypothetical protein
MCEVIRSTPLMSSPMSYFELTRGTNIPYTQKGFKASRRTNLLHAGKLRIQSDNSDENTAIKKCNNTGKTMIQLMIAK